MAVTNITKQAKDGAGGVFTAAYGTQSITPADIPVVCIKDPVTELPIAPATSVKQPAFGVAGTPSADVLSVQGSAAGLPIPVSLAASNWAVTRSTVTTTAAVIAAARADRKSVVITNLGGGDVYLGPGGVTPSTGVLLPGVGGSSKTIYTTATIYAVVLADPQDVSVEELH